MIGEQNKMTSHHLEENMFLINIVRKENCAVLFRFIGDVNKLLERCIRYTISENEENDILIIVPRNLECIEDIADVGFNGLGIELDNDNIEEVIKYLAKECEQEYNWGDNWPDEKTLKSKDFEIGVCILNCWFGYTRSEDFSFDFFIGRTKEEVENKLHNLHKFEGIEGHVVNCKHCDEYCTQIGE